MPEIVLSWELGIDLRMFRNRLGIDVAYCDNTSKDLVLNMPVSSASGVTKRYANGGTSRNYGWEPQVNGTLVKTRDVQWKAYVNWSRNRNEGDVSCGHAANAYNSARSIHVGGLCGFIAGNETVNAVVRFSTNTGAVHNEAGRIGGIAALASFCDV